MGGILAVDQQAIGKTNSVDQPDRVAVRTTDQRDDVRRDGPTTHGVSDDTAEIVARFRVSGASAACLCEPDAERDALVSDMDRGESDTASALPSALKAAGAKIVLATRTSSKPIATPDRDVDAFIQPGCDAVTALSRILDALERPGS